MSNITFGCDPEVFLVQDGEMVPAGVVFDALHIPRHAEVNCGFIYVDGCALEIQPMYGQTENDLVGHLKELLTDVNSIFRGWDILATPVIQIDLKKWVNDQHPELTVFGCDPDKSAWGDKFSPGSVDATTHPLRYGGCHLHLGGLEKEPRTRIIRLVKALDRTVGVMHTAVCGSVGIERTELYGRPGIYRFQPWGAEYRTPSNMILRDPNTFYTFLKLAGWTAENLSAAYDLFPDDLVVNTISRADQKTAIDMAAMVCKYVGVEIPMVHTDSTFIERWLL